MIVLYGDQPRRDGWHIKLDMAINPEETVDTFLMAINPGATVGTYSSARLTPTSQGATMGGQALMVQWRRRNATDVEIEVRFLLGVLWPWYKSYYIGL